MCCDQLWWFNCFNIFAGMWHKSGQRKDSNPRSLYAGATARTVPRALVSEKVDREERERKRFGRQVH